MSTQTAHPLVADPLVRTGVDGAATPDANVEAVRALLLARSEVGLRKYGTTTERTDLGPLAWLRHAQEEALDLAVYLEAEIQNRLRETGHSPSADLTPPDPQPPKK